MSRAFVKESDLDAADVLPDRVIDQARNLVTARGLALIESQIGDLRAQWTRAQAQDDKEAMARLARDLRYWSARRASAELVDQPADISHVAFGHHVTIARDDGREQTFQIVGIDEADPATGTLSYISPLAQALLGKEVGNEVRAGANLAEIIAIRT